MSTDLGQLNRSLRRSINSSRGYQPPIELAARRVKESGLVKQGSTALASLRPQEAVQVLAWLMDGHPEPGR